MVNSRFRQKLYCSLRSPGLGHIQFGEEEVPIGCRWDQSSGWSADQHWTDIYAAIHVTRVPGQCTTVPSQTVKGKHTHTATNTQKENDLNSTIMKNVCLLFPSSQRPFRSKVYLAVSEILKWMVLPCHIQPRTTVLVPALTGRHREEHISQGMEHMRLSVSLSPWNDFPKTILSQYINIICAVFCISDDSFVMGTSFELLFNVRPRSLTGLLLHVGNFSRSPYGPSTGHYLSVYMRRGEVRSGGLLRQTYSTNSVKVFW